MQIHKKTHVTRFVPSVELYGTELDNEINLSLQISSICNSALNQLHALLTKRSILDVAAVLDPRLKVSDLRALFAEIYKHLNNLMAH